MKEKTQKKNQHRHDIETRRDDDNPKTSGAPGHQYGLKEMRVQCLSPLDTRSQAKHKRFDYFIA